MTGCKKEEIIKRGEDSFLIKVKEKPVLNQANIAVKKILAEYLKIEVKKLKIIKGSRSKAKIFEI